MLKRIILCYQINKFYKEYGAYLDNAPTCTTMNNINDRNFLLDVLYDIREMLSAAKSCRDYDECEVLTNLYHSIEDYRNTSKLGHIVRGILATALVLALLWIGVSTLEVMTKNLTENPQYASWNMWILFTEKDDTIHTRYTAEGRYYTDGTVITDDGNEWSYSADTISDKTPYDGMPVNVGFDDNGTPDNITDDIVLGLVWDINTSVYDDLEDVLGDKFELTRDGNNIRIGGVH